MMKKEDRRRIFANSDFSSGLPTISTTACLSEAIASSYMTTSDSFGKAITNT
jgi:hypothetical protein